VSIRNVRVPPVKHPPLPELSLRRPAFRQPLLRADGQSDQPVAPASARNQNGNAIRVEKIEFSGSSTKNVPVRRKSYQKWTAVGGARL
jgi:hypothetical protein